MAMRKNANSRVNKKFFSRTAMRTRVANVNTSIPRGGIRK